MPTPDAGELHLTAAIPFLDKATLRAGPAGVPRINGHHRHARSLRLVADKRPQLSEAPTVVLAALAFANRHPASDVGQVFQPQSGCRVFGVRNKMLRDRMVDPPAKARFLSGHALQPTRGGFRASGLIGLFRSGTALADHFNVCALGKNLEPWRWSSYPATGGAGLGCLKTPFLG